MARSRPPDRFQQLWDAALRVFGSKGLRRARMADIAREMGVSPGSLYNYVESKEALFAWLVDRGGEAGPVAAPASPPASDPGAGRAGAAPARAARCRLPARPARRRPGAAPGPRRARRAGRDPARVLGAGRPHARSDRRDRALGARPPGALRDLVRRRAPRLLRPGHHAISHAACAAATSGRSPIRRSPRAS